ncbi:MAG: M28 family peptidase [Acidilobaceae archaeon]
MGIESVLSDLRVLVDKLYTESTINPGSYEEVSEVEKIRGIIESYLGVKTRVIEVPLLSWKLKSASLDPKPSFLGIAPYVESGSVEGLWFRVEGNPVRLESWRSFPEGRVAIVNEPQDPDDIKSVVLHASEAGALAVIVESESAPRAIVTNGYWGFNYRVGSPTPIPIVIVERGYSSKLSSNNRISLSIDSRVIESTGYTIEANIPSSSDDIILIGAHHDKWYSGFSDDIIGLAQAIITAKILSESKLTVRLLSFTAEEYGALGYASWYWAWGSRFYAKQLLDTDLIDKIRVYINYDMASLDPIIVSGSPQYADLVLAEKRCCECPECDSFSLASIGIPTLCIHSLWSRKSRSIYHTPYDTPDKSDLRLASEAVNKITKAILEGPKWDYMEKMIAETLGEGPLDARRIAYVILSLAKRVGWSRLYIELARVALKTIHYGSYRLDEVNLEAIWFPEVVVYVKLRNDIIKGIAPHEVWITGDEAILYTLRAANGKPIPVEALAQQYKFNIEHLWSKIEDIQYRLLK